MNLRPKTKRRLLELLTIAIAAGGVTTFGVIVLLHRHEAHRLAYRNTAMAAYQHGDYRTAADNFSKYLGNDRMDSEAIFDYAVARSKLTRADLSNLTEARTNFNRYLELNPGDVAAQHQLLQIYQKLRYTGELQSLTESLLLNNPNDVPALSAKLSELIRSQQYDAALAISLHLNQLTPDDVQMQGTTYQLMALLHKPHAELIGRADGMLKAHPRDPRFELLRAVAGFWTGDIEGTKQYLRSAAARPSPDPEFTLLLAGAFDRLGLWTDSRDLLERNTAVPAASAELKASLVQRFWEIGRYDEALLVLKDTNPGDPASDSNLLGLNALVLTCKSQSEAKPTPTGFGESLTALQQRVDDPIATGWASLLQAINGESSTDALETLHLCQAARRSDPHNPDAPYYLGLTYRRLGEAEFALQSFRQCTTMQPEWAAPYVMMARTFTQRGQIEEADTLARDAMDRDPDSLGIKTSFALISYRRLPPDASPTDIRPVLNFITPLRTLAPQDPQLLAAEVDLLARSNQRQDAINLAVASLATAAGASPTTLNQLANVDQANHLGIAALLTDRLADCQAKDPDQALDQVQAELTAGNPDLAKKLLPAFEAHPTTGWRLAWLQAREAVGDPGATAAWEKFADSLPKDLDVQTAALHSPAVNADRVLMDRTIDRVKTLTGDDAIQWKLARASWQLSATDDIKTNANAAAAFMSEVARIAPKYAPPQTLWADALLKLGDYNGAIAHLQIALQIDLQNINLSLKLARLYAEQGQTRELGSLVRTIEANPHLGGAQRLEAARLYRQLGDRVNAIKLLDDGQPIHPEDPARDVLLAQLHAELGEADQAQAIYNAWLSQKNPPSQILRAIAWFQASNGQLDQARNTIGNLTTDKDLIAAELEVEYGDAKIAAVDFQKSIQRGNTKAWLGWAGMALRNRDFTGAFNVANDGLKQLPGDSDLTAIHGRAQALAGLQLDADAQPLLDTLSVDPTNEAAAAALNALASSETASEVTDHLSAVAKKYPRFLPVQLMLTIRDFKACLYDQATDRATRLCGTFPIEPEPARLLTNIYSAAGQQDRAAAAADEWRSRTLDHPHAAEIAMASANLALHRPQRTESLLSWCLKAPDPADMNAAENPPLKARALELYARALCMEDQPDAGWNLIQLYAARSPIWRRRWLRIITNTADSAVATRYVKLLEPMCTTNTENDQLGPGEAWLTLASRFNDPASLNKAKAIVQPLTSNPSATADAWLLLGAIQQQQNDLPAAELSFTAATKLDSPTAKNNLAMVMLLRNEDPKTAQQLAQSAITQSPASSAFHSTLGEIDQRLNDLDGAKKQFQLAIKLNADNTEALIGLATVQSATGDISNATLLLQQAQAVMQLTHPALPAPVRDELEKLRQAVTKPATSAR